MDRLTDADLRQEYVLKPDDYEEEAAMVLAGVVDDRFDDDEMELLERARSINLEARPPGSKWPTKQAIELVRRLEAGELDHLSAHALNLLEGMAGTDWDLPRMMYEEDRKEVVAISAIEERHSLNPMRDGYPFGRVEITYVTEVDGETDARSSSYDDPTFAFGVFETVWRHFKRDPEQADPETLMRAAAGIERLNAKKRYVLGMAWAVFFGLYLLLGYLDVKVGGDTSSEVVRTTAYFVVPVIAFIVARWVLNGIAALLGLVMAFKFSPPADAAFVDGLRGAEKELDGDGLLELECGLDSRRTFHQNQAMVRVLRRLAEGERTPAT